MSKEIEYTKRSEITTFKARMKASKPHYLQKVISSQTVIKDALKPHFSTTITLFYPKLKPTQQVPVVMMSSSNGGGSCLVRSDTPDDLADVFDELSMILRSNEWREKWEKLKDVASGIVYNENFIDSKDFEKVETAKKNRKYEENPSKDVVDWM